MTVMRTTMTCRTMLQLLRRAPQWTAGAAPRVLLLQQQLFPFSFYRTPSRTTIASSHLVVRLVRAMIFLSSCEMHLMSS